MAQDTMVKQLTDHEIRITRLEDQGTRIEKSVDAGRKEQRQDNARITETMSGVTTTLAVWADRMEQSGTSIPVAKAAKLTAVSLGTVGGGWAFWELVLKELLTK